MLSEGRFIGNKMDRLLEFIMRQFITINSKVYGANIFHYHFKIYLY